MQKDTKHKRYKLLASIHSLLQPGTGLPINQTVHTSQDSSGEQSKFSFRDILDIVNPLHHIPIIGQLYRNISGDTIHPAMKIAGGALFGGPIGAAFSAVQLAIFQKKETIDIPAGGVNAETVAGSYPFAESEQESTVVSKIQYNNQHVPIVYSDGISNPARIQQELKPEILIASKPEQQAVYDATSLIRNTYGI